MAMWVSTAARFRPQWESSATFRGAKLMRLLSFVRDSRVQVPVVPPPACWFAEFFRLEISILCLLKLCPLLFKKKIKIEREDAEGWPNVVTG